MKYVVITGGVISGVGKVLLPRQLVFLKSIGNARYRNQD